MGKTLIITEKPSVARDYARILGVSGNGTGTIENSEYIITWCVGHLVEMCYPEKYDEKYKKWKLEDLPFLPGEYKYEVIGSVKKQYEIVHKSLFREDVELCLWAGDSGREGQVIEELIRRYGGVRDGLVEKRVWIDSTTSEEIKRGIREAKPYREYDRLSEAGIMRGVEDYAMGINFSRALSVKYAGLINKAAGTKRYAAIAVGRVMTCVLGMVVRREREIRNFKETIFYRVIGTFSYGGERYAGEWKVSEKSALFASNRLYGEKGFLKDSDARDFIDSLKDKAAVIGSKSTSKEKKKPPLLFNLAELQSECSKRFKISPEETLKIAQELYEKKLTTYPRTDARVLTSAVAKVIDGNLKGLTGYAPLKDEVGEILSGGLFKGLEKTQYTNDKKVTDHYAIIPTGNLSELTRISELSARVYELIVRRFLSIFYPPAEYTRLTLITNVGDEIFQTTAKLLVEPGYLKIAGIPEKKKKKSEGEEGEEEELNTDPKALLALSEKLKKGTGVNKEGFDLKTGKTTPPKRYTSGSMILAMENAGNLIEDEELRSQITGSGIGTSATRAGIIEKLVRIGYLALNKKTQVLTPKPFGEMVFEVVYLTMPSMLNPEMTASWEKGLSGVESGEIAPEEYKATLERYVSRYIENIRGKDLSAQIKSKINNIGNTKAEK